MKAGRNIIIPASLTGGALILSVLIGLLSGVSAGVVLFRALITAAVTFVFVMGSAWAVKTYLPELLISDGSESPSKNDSDQASSDQAGSRVNIVLDDDSDNPGGASFAGQPEQLDELEDGENQIAESDGNVHNSKLEESAMDTVTIQGGGASVDVLPSLDNLDFGSSSAGRSDDPDDMDVETPSEPEVSMRSSQRGSGMADNSDPEEIAKAVKTVLSRDQQK